MANYTVRLDNVTGPDVVSLGDGTTYATLSVNANVSTPLVSDTNPTLSADLNLNGNDITGTGDISITGTVDGRDVSADGTKLDGIEANADVTDAANVTAAGALMDSEVTNLAQVKAFDSSDYATSAQGALADSATQPGDNISTLTNDAGYTANVGDITGVTAGSGITGGGTSGTVTINHADTSSQGSVSNSGATVIQDVTLDGFGHVTALGSTTLTAATVGAASDSTQSTATWEAGTGTTESIVSPAKVKAAIDTLASSMPAGTVIHYAANSAPTGFIKANGAAVSRTTYATLFSAIGTTFGVGDGSTTFNVPDLRGEFVRGWDDGRGVDSGRSFGTAQDDQVGEHDHGFVDGRSYIVPRNVAASGRAFGTGAQDSGVVFDALTGQETRPTNVALLACIKF